MRSITLFTPFAFLAAGFLALSALPGCGSGGGGAGVDLGYDGKVMHRPDDGRTAAPATVMPRFIQTEPLPFREVIQPNDRVVFIGDDITQQGFYTRALASAVMGLRPTDDLRFFNGGKDGATAGSTQQWVGELLDLAEPTVAFICLGLNDGEFGPPSDAIVNTYQQNLTALAKQVKAHESVREVVIVSSPAVQTGNPSDGNVGGYNRTMRQLAEAAQQAASDANVRFIDTYEPMRVVYAEAAKVDGDGLTIRNRFPSEDGHTVLASVILWGLGVTSEELTPVGWAPLKPRRMGSVRRALGLELPTPEFQAARHSRYLYEKLREHDQIFFQAWRLAPRNPAHWDQEKLLTKAKQTWFELDAFARQVYAGQQSSSTAEREGGVRSQETGIRRQESGPVPAR